MPPPFTPLLRLDNQGVDFSHFDAKDFLHCIPNLGFGGVKPDFESVLVVKPRQPQTLFRNDGLNQDRERVSVKVT
jgi:hypothetical protein